MSWFNKQEDDNFSRKRKPWKKSEDDEKENECIDHDENEDIFDAVYRLEKRVKELTEKCDKLIKDMPSIQELKQKITSLETEDKKKDEFIQGLVHKLIDKPTVPTASQLYAASKVGSSSNSSATAGPKGKLP